MSQPLSLLLISDDGRPVHADAVADQNSCSLITAPWAEADAVLQEHSPAAIIAILSEGCDEQLTAFASAVAAIEAYTPLILVGAPETVPENALPGQASDDGKLLGARLKSALRVRALHTAALRRAGELNQTLTTSFAVPDPEVRSTALLFGRGPSYPGLSVALGEQLDLVGALSVEAAARHLNLRDIDGVFIGEGFSPRVIEAFLTVLSEDARFRNLPVVMTGKHAGLAAHELANLATIAGEPHHIVARAMPLIRQHGFEIQLKRALDALDSNGLLDPRTGLMTPDSFDRDFAQTVTDTLSKGGHLSAAQISFGTSRRRSHTEAARIISRLMRKMDFATLQDDGSIVAAFAETDLRAAHVIARRLASILQSTVFGSDDEAQLNPRVTLATLKANDSAAAIRERLSFVDVPRNDLRSRLLGR